MNKLAVVALGGNALLRDHQMGTIDEQEQNTTDTLENLVFLIREGYNLVITHGNGPQVGFILRRAEIAAEFANIHSVPLVNCDAVSQGAIGYQIQQAMDNEFRKRHLKEKLDNCLI